MSDFLKNIPCLQHSRYLLGTEHKAAETNLILGKIPGKPNLNHILNVSSEF
jgi:hypothetical protein